LAGTKNEGEELDNQVDFDAGLYLYFHLSKTRIQPSAQP